MDRIPARWDFRVSDIPCSLSETSLIYVIQKVFQVVVLDKYRVNISGRFDESHEPIGHLLFVVDDPQKIYQCSSRHIYISKIEKSLPLGISHTIKFRHPPSRRIFCSLSRSSNYILRNQEGRERSIQAWFYRRCQAVLEQDFAQIREIVYLDKHPCKRFFTQFILKIRDIGAAVRIAEKMHDTFLDREFSVLAHMEFSNKQERFSRKLEKSGSSSKYSHRKLEESNSMPELIDDDKLRVIT